MGQPIVNKLEACFEVTSLEDCEEALVVIKHDPITNYPLWAQLLLRFTYWATNYSGEAQLQTVCTTETWAQALAEDAGWRGIWVPVNRSLPSERCQWKPPIHFKSPLRKWHERILPDYLAIKRTILKNGLDRAETGLLKLKTILTAED